MKRLSINEVDNNRETTEVQLYLFHVICYILLKMSEGLSHTPEEFTSPERGVESNAEKNIQTGTLEVGRVYFPKEGLKTEMDPKDETRVIAIVGDDGEPRQDTLESGDQYSAD